MVVEYLRYFHNFWLIAAISIFLSLTVCVACKAHNKLAQGSFRSFIAKKTN